MEERNEIISKLKEELVAVRTKSSIETKYLHKVARARGQSLNRAYNAQTSDLEQQIWHAKKELEIEVRANQETEEFLRKKQAQLSQEIQKWMQKYEEDTEEHGENARAAQGEPRRRPDTPQRLHGAGEQGARGEAAARGGKADEGGGRPAEACGGREELVGGDEGAGPLEGYLQRKAAAGGGKKGKKGKGGKGKKKK